MLKIIKILFRMFLLLIVLLSCAALYARYVEPHRLTSNQLNLEHINAPSGFDGITIAVFSDTHFSEYYTLKDFEKVKTLINAKEPDIILFCGDLIDNFNTYTGDTEDISEALAGLKANLGKFAVFGNHDHGGGAHRAYSDIMEDGGFTVFVNEALDFPDLNMTLIGIDDFIFGQANVDIAGSAREDHFNFVFSHEPDIVDLILDCDIDFMVSGHTHGGQINLLFYKHIFLPPYGQNYLKGSYGFDNPRGTLLYVNSGLGTTKLPFRFMAVPEVTFVTINPE